MLTLTAEQERAVRDFLGTEPPTEHSYPGYFKAYRELWNRAADAAVKAIRERDSKNETTTTTN